MKIEHAIHTSAQTQRNEGYQIVARSKGLNAETIRYLTRWCPSHDGLLESTEVPVGLSFFWSDKEELFVTKSKLEGNEYSARRGERVLTHCLQIPASVFRKFAHNPFSLLGALEAGGHLETGANLFQPLESITLLGGSRAFKRGSLVKIVDKFGLDRLMDWLSAACTGLPLAFVCEHHYEKAIAAILCLLPVETRRYVSFTSGLRMAQSRPVHWITLNVHDEKSIRTAIHNGFQVIDCTENRSVKCATNGGRSAGANPVSDWAAFVEYCFDTTDFDTLEEAIQNRDAPKTFTELDTFSNQYLMRFPKFPNHFSEKHCGSEFREERTVDKTCAPAPPTCRSSTGPVHAHKRVHAREYLSAWETRATCTVAPEVVEKLESLDDIIFEAINGSAEALQRATEKWNAISKSIPDDLLDESREQYLRYATDVWNDCRERGMSGLVQSTAALDIILLLTS